MSERPSIGLLSGLFLKKKRPYLTASPYTQEPTLGSLLMQRAGRTPAFVSEGSGYDDRTANELLKLYPLTLPKPDKPWREGEPEFQENDGAFASWVWHHPSKEFPKGDWVMHTKSRDPRTGLLLKGRKHRTWKQLVAGEKAAGYEIYKNPEDNRYYSRPIDKQKTTGDNSPKQKYFGYELRGAYQSEDEYFKKNPNVAGMAAEDGRIVLNPYSKNSPQEQESVAKNEAIRLWMRDQKLQPKFNLTDAQKKQFEGTEYGKSGNELHAKHTIIARILSGDPSAKDATPMQKKWAESVMKRINKQK